MAFEVTAFWRGYAFNFDEDPEQERHRFEVQAFWVFTRFRFEVEDFAFGRHV